jgi:hypothetical protein
MRIADKRCCDNSYCKAFGRLETRFRYLNGFINNFQVVTTINYNTVTHLHNLQSLHANIPCLSPVVFTYLYDGSYTSLTESHTSNEAFNSQSKSSHDELSVAVT